MEGDIINVEQYGTRYSDEVKDCSYFQQSYYPEKDQDAQKQRAELERHSYCVDENKCNTNKSDSLKVTPLNEEVSSTMNSNGDTLHTFVCRKAFLNRVTKQNSLEEVRVILKDTTEQQNIGIGVEVLENGEDCGVSKINSKPANQTGLNEDTQDTITELYSNPFKNFPSRRRALKHKKPRQRFRSLPNDLNAGEDIAVLGNVARRLLRESRSFSREHYNTATDLQIYTDDKKTNESLYRGLLQCLLHPLGAPDNTIGLRPGDLIDHVCTVFDIDREDHEILLRDELGNKPRYLQLNLGIIEATGLKKTDSRKEDPHETYCLVTVVRPGRGISGFPIVSRPAGNNSPNPSLGVSPSSSPSPGLSSSTDPDSPASHRYAQDHVVHRTQTCSGSKDPKWNEEFIIEIDELLTDELHVFICDQEYALEGAGHHGDRHRLKHLLRLLRHSTEQETLNNLGCFGKIVLPLRDIPVLGTDSWFPISALSSPFTKAKVIGTCRLQLHISYRNDANDGFNFSSEDYQRMYQRFMEHHLKSDSAGAGNSADGGLPKKDQMIMQMFAGAHGIGKLSQAMTQVNCILDTLANANGGHHKLREITLERALETLRMTWATMQFGQLTEKMPLTDAEISVYRKRAGRYIRGVLSDLEQIPDLYPPTLDTVNAVRNKLGLSAQLLNLDLWESRCPLQKEFSNKVLKKIQDDLNEWINTRMTEISQHEHVIKDTVIPEVTQFIDLVNTLCEHCSLLGIAKQFYHEMNINYYRIISFMIEKKVTCMGMALMTQMDRYMKRYGSYMVNIMAASRLTLRLYSSVRNLLNRIRDHVSRRDLMRLGISKYQDWFKQALVFWLQTFRTEAFNRMDKALEIDKDVVLATNLVQYSHSSVDVLACFAKIKDEWRHIDYREPDCLLMGVTTVTDIICDGARLYAEKIHQLFEENDYFISRQSQVFEVSERLCIMLNNIENVRLYLSQLPALLDWDMTTLMISTYYCDDDVGEQADRTLNRLVNVTDSEIRVKTALLTRQIAAKMMTEIKRYMLIFTQERWGKPSSLDSLVVYLTTNLHTLHSKLMPTLLPAMMEHLWSLFLTAFNQQLKLGERVEYYVLMEQHLRTLGAYFNLKGQETKGCNSEHRQLKQRLDLHTLKTEDLMLQYFTQLTQDLTTPTEMYGHLALKLGYMEETKGNATVFVKVLRGSDLPGLDATGFSDPYVVVSLQPEMLFDHNKPQQTFVISQTLNPVYNITFQFPNVPHHYLSKPGTCILLTVLDYDRIGRDDFAGEVVVELSSLSRIEMGFSVDSKPVIILPLHRPQQPKDGPYQVLADREWDKNAKTFVQQRNRFIRKHVPRTDGRTGSNFFFSMFNKLMT